jgi:hypothetical protein
MSAVTDDLQRLADCVRRNLLVEPTSITDVGELSNINYVYRVETPDSSFYLKVIPEQPKRLPVKLPRERVFSEAAGLRLYREFAGADLVVPEVLFVDGDEMALAMSDVGDGRQILFQVIAEDFQLLAEQGEAIGRALGRIHAATRGRGTPRPPQEEMIIRKVIFDGLLAPGAKQAFPELGMTSMRKWRRTRSASSTRICGARIFSLHTAPGSRRRFRGSHLWRSAFDLGTLIAVALVPALDRPQLLSAALDFVSRLTASWRETCGDPEWARAVLPRTFRATATFLAAGLRPSRHVSDTGAADQGHRAGSASHSPADFETFRIAFSGSPQPRTHTDHAHEPMDRSTIWALTLSSLPTGLDFSRPPAGDGAHAMGRAARPLCDGGGRSGNDGRVYARIRRQQPELQCAAAESDSKRVQRDGCRPRHCDGDACGGRGRIDLRPRRHPDAPTARRPRRRHPVDAGRDRPRRERASRATDDAQRTSIRASRPRIGRSCARPGIRRAIRCRRSGSIPITRRSRRISRSR